jgi:hypothetical protein
MRDNTRMDRNELNESAYALIGQLSTRQLEAVIGILRCLTGGDESDSIPEAAGGEGLPPGDIFNKFFS